MYTTVLYPNFKIWDLLGLDDTFIMCYNINWKIKKETSHSGEICCGYFYTLTEVKYESKRISKNNSEA